MESTINTTTMRLWPIRSLRGVTRWLGAAALLSLLPILIGCGQTGPLYLPQAEAPETSNETSTETDNTQAGE